MVPSQRRSRIASPAMKLAAPNVVFMIMQPDWKEAGRSIDPLARAQSNIRAEFKLRRGIHTNEKHRQSSGTLRTDNKKLVQEKFDALRRRSRRSGGRPCRRSERSSGCPTPAS